LIKGDRDRKTDSPEGKFREQGKGNGKYCQGRGIIPWTLEFE
jgi:hypothetical protein